MNNITDINSSINQTKNDISTLNSYIGDSSYNQVKVEDRLLDYEEYNDTLQDAKTTQIVSTINRVSINIPNYKDKAQWLAGGDLRDQSFAGGSNFSSTSTPSFDNKEQDFSIGFALLNGDFGFLNRGLININNKVNGGEMLDLFLDSEKILTIVNREEYKIEVIITTADGSIIAQIDDTFNIGGDDGFADGFSTDSQANNTSMSLAEAQAISQNSFALQTSPINIAISIIGIMTSKNADISISTIASAAVLGTVEAAIAGAITNSVGMALGITSIGLAIGLAVGVFGVVSEAFGIALGVDNSFGYGGSYGKGFSESFGVVGFAESKGFMGITSLAEQIGFSVGLTDVVSVAMTNQAQTEVVGYQTEMSTAFGNVSVSNDMQGSFNLGFESMDAMHGVMGTSISMTAPVGSHVGFSMDLSTGAVSVGISADDSSSSSSSSDAADNGTAGCSSGCGCSSSDGGDGGDGGGCGGCGCG